MSIVSSKPPAALGAWSLTLAFVILLALLAGSPRMFTTTLVPPVATEPVGFGPPHAAPVVTTDRDPSVPLASGVSFPSGGAAEPPAETF